MVDDDNMPSFMAEKQLLLLKSRWKTVLTTGMQKAAKKTSESEEGGITTVGQ